MTERVLPSNMEAEEGVLGSIIIDPDAIVDVFPILKAEEFYGQAQRTIYETVVRLYQKDEPADYITLAEELERRGELEDVGGNGYIMSLISRVPTSGNAVYYAKIVSRLATRRQIIKVGSQMVTMAYNDKEDDMLSRIEALVLSIGRDRTEKQYQSIEDYMPSYLSRLEKLHKGEGANGALNTGIRPLNVLLGKGLKRGKLYIPAARPGVGKSTLCQNIAYRGALKHGHKVGFVSLEMPEEELMDRFMSMHTKLDSLRLQNGQIEDNEWESVVRASDELSTLGIYFQYAAGIYLDDMCSLARRMVQRHGISLLVVDYLQLLKVRIDGKRLQPREMEVAEIARTLKALAGELNIAILAPAQINRQVERTAGMKDENTGLTYRMPMLADLRESGELEQSADVVMFLARAEEDETKVKLFFAKHRGGPLGEIDLHFDGPTTRFIPITVQQYDEYGHIIEE